MEAIYEKSRATDRVLAAKAALARGIAEMASADEIEDLQRRVDEARAEREAVR